jgi:hypothetical protein
MSKPTLYRALYRASEGELTVVATAQDAIEPGRYDENNWGHDWVLISAWTETEARKISAAYDRNINNDARRKRRYLQPATMFTERLFAGRL